MPPKKTIGNFWVDLIRTTLRILLPIAFVAAIVLASQGVIQNFHASTHATTVAGAEQVIPGGPVASQIAIKQLGTNGGGFFNTNSSHPFENPNGLTNMIEMFFLIMIPFAATYALGVLCKGKKFGWVLFGVMFALMIASISVAVTFETKGNPVLNRAGVTQTVTASSPGGNLEGKEVRVRADGDRHVGRRDDRFVERLGERLPRQLHAHRRDGPAHEHPAR